MDKRILIISTVGLSRNGISTVIYNYASHMNRKGLCLTFVGFEDIPPDVLEEYRALGNVVILPNRKKHPVRYYPAVWKLLRQGFDVAHIHGNSGTMFPDIAFAKLAGVPKRILHGHSSSCDHKRIHRLLREPMYHLATDHLTCSELAGQWLYGNKPFQVLNNAIDPKRYAYREGIRNEIRRELGLKKEFVIGHVGNFTPAKNHLFLLDVFAEYQKKDPQAKLLLVGDSRGRTNVQKEIECLQLKDAVILTGSRNDSERMYSAMDLFLFPSKYEGMGLAALEAQANELPVLASDTIPKAVKCLDTTEFMSLEAGAEVWAEKISEMRKNTPARTASVKDAIRAKGFDIHKEAENLRSIYLSEPDI